MAFTPIEPGGAGPARVVRRAIRARFVAALYISTMLVAALPGPGAGAASGPGLVNIADFRNGARIVSVTSEWAPTSQSALWSALALIDGGVSGDPGVPLGGWASKRGARPPQEVVLGFDGDNGYVVAAVQVNPYCSESSDLWAKDIEIWVSPAAPDSGFVLVGSAVLQPRNDYQEVPIQAGLKARYIKLVVKSTQAAGQSYCEVGELRVLASVDQPGINVALAANGGRIVSMTSQYGKDWRADNLIDGVVYRDGLIRTWGWASSGATLPQEVVIALAPRTDPAAAHRVDRVAINPCTSERTGRWAKEVDVLTSTDGTSWSLADSATLAPENRYQAISFPPVPARFVKVVVRSRQAASDSFSELGEVRVYTSTPAPAATTAEIPSVITLPGSEVSPSGAGQVPAVLWFADGSMVRGTLVGVAGTSVIFMTLDGTITVDASQLNAILVSIQEPK